MIQNIFATQLLAKHSTNKARVVKVTTPHGEFTTPCFMPVGTRAFVNHMTPDDLRQSNSQIILGGNTYHMLVNPGMDVIQAAGGMHQMMDWQRPMLTDSGGYQVFSLSKNNYICKIDERGAHFKHPISGKLLHLTPQTSIEAQKIIGADIIMAFDECTPEAGGRAAAEAALARTHRWLLESIAIHEQSPNSAYGFRQALFGIIQGGSFPELRAQSAEFVVQQNLDGIAIGGEVIGYNMQKTMEILDWLAPLLPENKVRYTMGVGLGPQDLLDAVAHGADIFDCVAPTRNARHGSLYHGQFVEVDNWLKFADVDEENSGRILIKKTIYAKDDRPILDGCMCHTCQHFSRAYLHLLFKQNSSLYCQLACLHNVYMMQLACDKMRLLLCSRYS